MKVIAPVLLMKPSQFRRVKSVTPLAMNSKTRLLISCLAILAVSATVAYAGGQRPGFSASRATVSRGGGAQARPAVRGFNRGFQRPSYNWAAGNRINNFARTQNWNRTAVNLNRTRTTLDRGTVNLNRTAANLNRASTRPLTSTTTWNRFNRNTTAFNNNWSGSHRFGNGGFNRGGNWWRNHHRGCDNNFIFFGGFGFPLFLSAWDFGFFPTAYYPYYPYSTPYVYDPYYPYYGSAGYPGYIDGGYPADPGYQDNGYVGPNDDRSGYNRDGAERGSVVAQVQERLAKEGYYKGDIDGVAGSRTYYAIRSYQRDHNLQVDGRINDELLGEMGLR
jgi:Putative peptidoglycan binding domain